MADTKQQLARAFELIRQDHLEEAVQIIRPITQSQPDNPDAWWLMANAASEPRDARRALVNLLKLKPNYPKARELLEQLNDIHPPNDQELMMLMELEDVMPESGYAADSGSSFSESLEDSLDVSSEIDDLFKPSPAEEKAVDFGAPSDKAVPEKGRKPSGEEDWALPESENPFEVLLREEIAGIAEEGGSSRRVLIVAGAAVVSILLVIVVVGVVLTGGGDNGSPPDNSTADAGPLMVVDAAVINAEQAQLLELVRSGVELDAQMGLGPDSKAIYTPVEGGYALVVQACAEPSPNMPRLVTKGLAIAITGVAGTAEVSGALAMVGVNVADCSHGNDTLYRAFAPIQAALDFNNSAATDFVSAFPVFQKTWIINN